MVQHILRDVFSRQAKLAIAKAVYALLGVELGLCIAYFGSGLSFAGISRLLGEQFGLGNPLYAFFWSIWYQAFAVLFVPALGAVLIYRFGRGRGFKTPFYLPETTSEIIR